MKKYSKFIYGGTLFAAACFLVMAIVTAANCARNAAEDFSSGEAALAGAEKDLRHAEKDFAAGEKASGQGVSSTSAWSQAKEPPEGQNAPQNPPQGQRKQTAGPNAGEDVPGSVPPGYNGYMGTYVDPANGDIVTSVIAPTSPHEQEYQNYPVIIAPQVGNWDNNSNSGWNNGWQNGWNNGWNNGWYGPGQEVPGYPYPPAPPGFRPSGQVPGYPFPPAPPGYRPPPPSSDSWPGYWPPPGSNGSLPGAWPRPPLPNLNPGVGPVLPPGSNSGAWTPPVQNPGNPGGIMPPQQVLPSPPYAPPFIPGQWPGSSGSLQPSPAYPSTLPGQQSFPKAGDPRMKRSGPRSQLTPPNNPGRPGSLPLVAPNFPPRMEMRQFSGLRRMPLARPVSPDTATRKPHALPQSVPGSPQSWLPAYWSQSK